MANDVFDLSRVTAGLHRDGTSQLIERVPGPPKRIDGFTVGAPIVIGPGPHGGERHPDGDELLYVISGRITVIVEEEGVERTIDVSAGEGFIVPRGTWHRVVSDEPSRIVHVTPGPNGDYRPSM